MRVADTFQPNPLFLILITLCFMAASPAQTDGVIVVIDTSGSMASVAPELKSAVKRFLSELPAGTYVGLVSFDTFSHVLAITRLDTPADFAHLNAQLDALHFTGANTNLDEGIKGAQAALWQISQRANDANPDSGGSGTPDGTLLLFSDGISDPSAEKGVVDLTQLAKRVFPAQSGYNVYLIGLSEDSTQRLASAYRAEGNITYLGISNRQLGAVLRGIRDNGTNLRAVVTQGAPSEPRARVDTSTAASNAPPSQFRIESPHSGGTGSPWLVFFGISLAFLGGLLLGRLRKTPHVLKVRVSSDVPLNDDEKPPDAFAMETDDGVIHLGPDTTVSLGSDDWLDHQIPGLPGTWTLHYHPGQHTLKKVGK